MATFQLFIDIDIHHMSCNGSHDLFLFTCQCLLDNATSSVHALSIVVTVSISYSFHM